MSQSTNERLLGVLGIVVVDVPGLDVEVSYVENVRVGLIRAGLDPGVRRKALDWLLGLVGA